MTATEALLMMAKKFRHHEQKANEALKLYDRGMDVWERIKAEKDTWDQAATMLEKRARNTT